jgi:Ferredoxin subunits of nitrite reductase and ring-hydroxylating dioxygenases
MKNCIDEDVCSGRRDFLVKATATTGGLLLSLAGAKALTAQTADNKIMGDQDDVVLKLDEKSPLNRPGGSQTIETKAGKIIVVRNSDMSVSAFLAKCTHKGGPIAYNEKTGQLECPWHHSRFDTKTGQVLGGPAKEPLPAYSAESAVVVDLKPKA